MKCVHCGAELEWTSYAVSASTHHGLWWALDRMEHTFCRDNPALEGRAHEPDWDAALAEMTP